MLSFYSAGNCGAAASAAAAAATSSNTAAAAAAAAAGGNTGAAAAAAASSGNAAAAAAAGGGGAAGTAAAAAAGKPITYDRDPRSVPFEHMYSIHHHACCSLCSTGICRSNGHYCHRIADKLGKLQDLTTL